MADDGGKAEKGRPVKTEDLATTATVLSWSLGMWHNVSTKFNKRFILAIQTQRETKISSALKPRSWPLIFGLSFFALERSLSQDITNTSQIYKYKENEARQEGCKTWELHSVLRSRLHICTRLTSDCWSASHPVRHGDTILWKPTADLRYHTVSVSVSMLCIAIPCYFMIFHVPNRSRPVLQIYANLCKSQLFSPAFHLRQAPELNWPGEAKTVQWKAHRTQQTDANEVVET